MTTTAPSTRQRRTRVLCIGLNSSRELLQNCLAQPPLLVDNLFQAMGEMTAAPADKTINTAIVAGSALRGVSDDAVESLRDIDPSVRIVLVQDTADSERLAGRRDLFEVIMPAPLTAGSLAAALESGASNARSAFSADDELAVAPSAAQSPSIVAATSPAHAVPTPAPAPAPSAAAFAPAEGQKKSTFPAAESAAPPRPTRSPSIEVMTTNAAADRPAAGRADASTETLGDVDLVESILSNNGRLRELAVRLIAQQTGWTDVTLHPIDQFVEGASAAVNFDNNSFGILTSSATDARSLKPWAEWMARWLALDEAHSRNRHLAYSDDLTGAWNRRFFHEFLNDALKRARELRLPVTVMVFDIDDFKIYNDRYSHEAGDEILIETVRLLESVIRKSDRVCRIGGDEFAVVFADLEGPRAAGSSHPDAVGEIAARFQKQICSMRFPKLAREAPGTLTISAGLSTFPWDGDQSDQLLRLADERAMHSKRSGKNIITFGPGQPC